MDVLVLIDKLDDVVHKGVTSHREMAAFRLLNNEHLEPGGVYYVGDFAVVGTSKILDTTIYPLVVVTKYRQQWGLDPPRNRYVETTADMKRAFPRFAGVQTTDRMARQ